MLWHNVLVYLDDIVIYTRTWQEHLATLDEVFLRLRAAGLKASPGKCDIAQDRLLYLGHIITREGILPDPANVEAIQQAERPRTVTAFKSFVGMTTYYADFVQGHATQAKPLYDLFKKNVEFTWTQECETAFQGLKQFLISPPVLRRPDTSLPYLLHTDWSLLAIGAVLSQVDLNGEEHPIAFGSRILHGAERNYSATEGECLAVVHFIEHWRAILHGAQFQVVTDHVALKWLMTTAHAGRLARWALKLQGHNFSIGHRSGTKHASADDMSRPPLAAIEDTPHRVMTLATMQKRCRPAEFDQDSPVRVEYAAFDCMSLSVSSDTEGDESSDQQDKDFAAPVLSGGGFGSDEPQELLLSGPPVDPDMVCEVCGLSEDDSNMLLCDRCNKGFHITCLQPPLSEIPAGKWYCEPCVMTSKVLDISEGSRDITKDSATVTFLQTGQLPDGADKRERVRIKARASHFTHSSGKLYHKETGNIVPEVEDRAGLVQSIHKLGHFGIARTLNMVGTHYWWRGMSNQVKQVILHCRDCQLIHASFNEPRELHPVPVRGIYVKVGLDLIGPLQPTTARGNRYIITSMDYGSKWAEARAVPNKESQTVADFFWEDVICRHGTVAEVVTDQGRELQGEFQALIDSCYIDYRLTSPHHPQSNGLTERFNETLSIALRKMVQDHPEDWDMHLPSILLGYRASIQASTQYSLFFLLHGYEMPLPVKALHPIGPPTPGMLDPTAQSIVDNMVPLHKARTVALANIQQAQAKQKQTYAARTRHGAKTDSVTGPTATKADKGKGIQTSVVLTSTPATAPAAPTSTPSFANPVPTLEPSMALAGPSTSVAPIIAVPTNPAHTPSVQIGDFVLVRKHEKVRTSGNRKGKLADKVEGPFVLHTFTDASKLVAVLVDAEDHYFKKRTADLCVYRGYA